MFRTRITSLDDLLQKAFKFSRGLVYPEKSISEFDILNDFLDVEYIHQLHLENQRRDETN